MLCYSHSYTVFDEYNYNKIQADVKIKHLSSMKKKKKKKTQNIEIKII